MEHSSDLGGNARSFGERVTGGLRTTTGMIAMSAVILLLAVKKVIS
jgi:hypothetical protein